jgi:hypothetical protein
MFDYLKAKAEDNKKFLIYFHNLGYDGRFCMSQGIKQIIDKNTKIFSIDFDAPITFKDSLQMLTMPLKSFARAFKKQLKDMKIEKEVFPYRYYTYDRIQDALLHNKPGVISECGKDEIPKWNVSTYNHFRTNCKKNNHYIKVANLI